MTSAVSDSAIRFGVRARLLLSFLSITTFSVLGAIAAVYALLQIAGAFDLITEKRVPVALIVQELSREAEGLVALGPAMLSSTSLDEQEQLSDHMYEVSDRVDKLLEDLKKTGVDPESVNAIKKLTEAISLHAISLDGLFTSNISYLERKEAAFIELSTAHDLIKETLTSRVRSERQRVSELQTLLGNSGLLPQDRTAATKQMLEATNTAALLDEAQLAVADIVATLLRVMTAKATEAMAARETTSSGPTAGDFPKLTASLKKAIGTLEVVAQKLDSATGAELNALIKKTQKFWKGGRNVFRQRALELDQIKEAKRQLAVNAEQSRRLAKATSLLVGNTKDDIASANIRARSVQRISTGVMIAVILLSILCSALIVWLYVGRNLIARLTALSDSMLAIAGGNLKATLPEPGGGDEISRMAAALVVFRDTAVEVEKSNLRDIEEARRRLVDAIENSSEGFAFYDPDDRLVICNNRYKQLLYPDADIGIEPEMAFETIIRNAAENGYIIDAEDRIDEWVAERLALHHNPGKPRLQQRTDGRWILITERKTGDGGTVAIYSDITDLKQREQELTSKSNALEQLSNQLAKYLSPQIYNSIFSGEQEVRLVSQRKKLTVFFSDLVGFTTTTEKLESEDLTHLLNQYLTEMSQIALDHGATIDKYIGDAIVIFFGDPETLGIKEDAAACVTMAIAMRKRMTELETVWRESGLEEPLQCRIGISTGYCTVGNFGSEDRMDYTIIGGGVNLAARLETACAPNEILISHETYVLVEDVIQCDEFDKIEVKGIAKPVATYQVIDLHENLGDGNQPIRAMLPHARLDADVSMMSIEEREEATKVLLDAVERLSNSDARHEAVMTNSKSVGT